MKYKEKNTVAKFIRDNKNLLTVFGAFVAITTFAMRLPIKPISAVLTFIFLTLTIIIWLEIWEQFPSGHSTWKLTIFENLLSFGLFVLAFYWILDYRKIWGYVMPFFIALILMSIISVVLKKYKVFNRLFHVKPNECKILRHAIGITLQILILYISIFISFSIGKYVAPHVNAFLDKVYSEFQQENKSQ